MCEFKILRLNDNAQIAEEILILGYTENNELLFRDILGAGEKAESALILEVNTMSQKVEIFEHPIIKDFVGLMKDVQQGKANEAQIEALQSQLEALKKEL